MRRLPSVLLTDGFDHTLTESESAMYCTNGTACKHGCTNERRCETEGFKDIWMSPYELARLRGVESENAEYRELLRELLVQLCENPGIREDGNAPGHAHEVPGVWDSDNGELAGKPCAWCAVWARAAANGLVGSNAEAHREAACGRSGGAEC